MNPNLSGAQFSGQLKMFMSPDELIDSTNKMDSELFDVYENRARANPRAQWEHPASGWGGSLKEQKLGELRHDSDVRERFNHPSWDTAPPVELTHYRTGSRRPMLSEGHHRLAHAERMKIPYMAVVHHKGEV